jgi:predicted O-methyltransferase YrrM
MDISSAKKIDGWMSAGELMWLAQIASQSTNVVELGAYKGRSTYTLAQHTLGWVYVVDHWQGDPNTPGGAHIRDEFYQNLEPFKEKLQVLEMDSKKAWTPLSLLLTTGADLIFIDDNHEYEHVKWNVHLYRRLVRRGGILAGHDFGVWPGVQRAVQEEFGRNFSRVQSIWWVKL